MKRLSVEEAENLAIKFRSENGLSLSEPIATKTLLRKMKVLTIFRPLSEDYFGLSLKSKNGECFMLINSNSTIGWQHFTIAHEFYHLFYDSDPKPHICLAEGGTSPLEKNADLFASTLLLPREGILMGVPSGELFINRIQMPTIIRLEQLFAVSRQSLLIRLKSIGIINEVTLKKLQTISPKQSARQFGYDLSLYESGNENLVLGDFGEKARILFDLGKISEGHYQELLNLWTNGKS